MITISYFAPSTTKSIELYHSISEFCKRQGYDVSFKNAEMITQYEFLVGVHGDTISIVDASIESVADRQMPNVYPILTAQINIFKHILVVSRTPLPLNICPKIRGGFPNPLMSDAMSNDDIVQWLKTNINNIVKSQESAPTMRIRIESQQALLELKPQMEMMLEENLRDVGSNYKKKVLISYRSRYYENVLKYISDFKKETVEDIEFHVVQSKNERILSEYINNNDALVLHERLCGEDEAPTPMQRWRMVGQLEDIIREMDEVWLYNTDDYGDSWWTQAEAIMTIYDNHGRSEKDMIKFRTLLNNSMPSFISRINISSEQRAKIVRYLSNTRLDTMGPEVMSSIHQLENIAQKLEESNFLIRFLIKRNIKKMLRLSIPSNLSKTEQEDMLTSMIQLYMSPTEIRKYISDDVFKDEFWYKISYYFPTSEEDFDLEQWISGPMNDLTPLTEADLDEGVNKGKIEILTKNGVIIKKISDGNPYYLWLATRMGKVNGDNGLEKFRTYIISDLVSSQ